MEKYDVVIIGGGPAGVTCAISAHNVYPDKKVAVVRKENMVLLSSGIPYSLVSLNTIDEDILSDKFLINNGIDLIIDEVIKRNGKTLELVSGRQIVYDKLVLSIDSTPVTPQIDGIDKRGVYIIQNNLEYLKQMRKFTEKSQNIVVITNGGYIGLEIADEMFRARKKVTIIELKENLLELYMDAEFGNKARDILETNGIKVHLSQKVKSILGSQSVTGVKLENGEEIPTEMVIISSGSKPHFFLAKKFNLAYDPKHGILVNEYLQTSDKNVFAIGDCTAKKDFFTGKFTDVRLSSTAMAEARLVGANLFKIKVIRKFIDVLGSFSYKICDTAFGVSGMTEAKIKSMKLDYVIGEATTIDRYPFEFIQASKMHLKLIFAHSSHVLLGAQMYGGDSVGEMVNVFSVMILNKMTDMEINNLQISTHPLLTTSPFVYPIFTANIDAINKRYLRKCL